MKKIVQEMGPRSERFYGIAIKLAAGSVENYDKKLSDILRDDKNMCQTEIKKYCHDASTKTPQWS